MWRKSLITCVHYLVLLAISPIYGTPITSSNQKYFVQYLGDQGVPTEPWTVELSGYSVPRPALYFSLRWLTEINSGVSCMGLVMILW